MDSHTKSYKSPDPGVPIQSLYTCINCMLGLPVVDATLPASWRLDRSSRSGAWREQK